MSKVAVEGYGKISGQPDIARIQVSVMTDGVDQKEARQSCNAASAEVVKVLKEACQENDLHVVPPQVYPEYIWTKTKRKLQGYKGRNTISVKLRNLDIAQELLSKLNEIDPESIQVSSFQYDIDDKEPLGNEARVKAFAVAKKRAEVYAQQTEMTLGKPLEINESLHFGGGGGRHPSGKFAAARAIAEGSGGDEVLEMGDVEVTVNVTVVFELNG